MTTVTAAPELDLLAALRAGDDQAAEAFVRLHTPRLLTLARRFLRNEHDIADAVQDAFLSAFKSLPSFEGGSSLGTWLHRIVVNVCLMKLRSSSRRKSFSIEELLPRFDETGHHVQPICRWAQPAHAHLAGEETRATVRACIDQLPEDFRAVLVLRDIEEFDTERTAAMLGVNVGAVKTRLHRARQALRTLLASQLDA